MATPPAVGTALDASRLHPALSDPVLASMAFLNEIALRFPDAISFAPGAPNERFFEGIDVNTQIETFVRHLRRRGLDEAAIRRTLYQYGPSRGIIADLIADALRRDEDIDVPAEAVVVTVGAQEAMYLTLRSLHATASDAIGVVTPAYVGVLGAARLLGVPVVAVDALEARGARASLTSAYKKADRDGLRLRSLYVAPDFANPSGVRLPYDSRLDLLAMASDLDLVVLEDNAYGFTAPTGGRLPTLKALDGDGGVVHIGTFAKIALPGVRIGFAVADQQVRAADGSTHLLAADIAAAKGMVTLNTSPIAQAIAGGMLLAAGGTLALLGADKAALYRRNLAALVAAVRRHLGPLRATGHDVSWNEPDGGLFLTVSLPFPADEALLEISAREHGVLWTPMRHFHLGTGGDLQMRLSCSSLDELQIDSGVARLRGLLDTMLR